MRKGLSGGDRALIQKRQADFVRNGNAKQIMSLSKENTTTLWNSVQNSKFAEKEKCQKSRYPNLCPIQRAQPIQISLFPAEREWAGEGWIPSTPLSTAASPGHGLPFAPMTSETLRRRYRNKRHRLLCGRPLTHLAHSRSAPFLEGWPCLLALPSSTKPRRRRRAGP